MWRGIQHYLRPASLEELWPLLADTPDARVVAGGTDLLVRVRNRLERPETLVSLRSIPEISGVTVEGELIFIGATTTIAELARHPMIRERSPVLAQAAGELGGPQIRNVATVGGNLCNASPCADTAPPLLVLEARVRLVGPQGCQRELALEQFLLGPGETALHSGEILAGVLLGPPRPAARALFLKKRRVRMDLALASVATLLELEGERCSRVRVAAGSVAPTPVRLHAVERLLEGQPLSDELLAQAQHVASESVAPITDVRSTEAYRRQITGVYVRRALEQLRTAIEEERR